LIISGAAAAASELPAVARQAVAPLREGNDFRVDYRSRRIAIRESGWLKLERALGLDDLAAAQNIRWQHALHNALHAHGVYQRDVDYIVQDGQVLLVDDHTGRVSPDKRLADGLHQALEAKEGLVVRAEDQTLAKISYQTFFRLYPQLCGMTGTAYTARHELQRTYGLRTVVIPPNEPVARSDQPPLVFKSSDEKFAAVVAAVAGLTARGRPVLVGTTSVKESEAVSRLLAERGINHSVLNAKDDSAEAAIIAQAGRPAAVTVSTNMAGRGVDILLGGNPQALAGADPKRTAEARAAERVRVVRAGGLMVIGTGLHESRRIDDQLRGRAGRQGDPGGSRYFLSLNDPIYRKFGQRDRGHQVLRALRERLRGHPWGEPIRDQGVLRTLRGLQRKVEVENESVRLDVLRYDLVAEQQRRTIYEWRQTLLARAADQTAALLQEMASELFAGYQTRLGSADRVAREEATAELLADAAEVLGASLEDLDPGSSEAAAQATALVQARLSELRSALGTEQFAARAAEIVLSTIDQMWTDHLGELERLEDAVGLRGYAELDPVVEYTREAHQAYGELLRRIRLRALAHVIAGERESVPPPLQ
jgi:preprotein translocase subunit SecA